MMGEGLLLMEERKNEEFVVTMIKYRHDPHTKICCRSHSVVVRLIRGLCGSPLQARLTLSLSLSVSDNWCHLAGLPADGSVTSQQCHTFLSEASSGSAVPPSPGTEPTGCEEEEQGRKQISRLMLYKWFYHVFQWNCLYSIEFCLFVCVYININILENSYFKLLQFLQYFCIFADVVSIIDLVLPVFIFVKYWFTVKSEYWWNFMQFSSPKPSMFCILHLHFDFDL